MERIKIRLRLSGHRFYEQPVSLFAKQPLKTGDFVEVPHEGQLVRAKVTSTSSPICREGAHVTYPVYADELDNQKNARAGSGEPALRDPLAAL